MKKLVFGAAALTLTGTAVANDGDWALLDQDIQALSASYQGLEGPGMNFGGRIRAMYENSGDVDTDPITAGSQDLGGFSIYNARLYAYGTVSNDVSYRLEVDFNGVDIGLTGAAVRLLDAYLDVPVGEAVKVRAGQFRASVLRSSLIDSGNLFFTDRSMNAALFAGRSQGVAAHGEFDQFNWAVTIQNGSDGVADDLFYAIRGEIDIVGEGTDLMQGAYGASEDLEASIGAAYFNDDFEPVPGAGADGIAFDASLATNKFSVELSAVDLGDAIPTSNMDLNERSLMVGIAPMEANTTPFSVQGTLMLTQPTTDYGGWEVGARFQDMDNSADTRVFDIGLNYYVNGHDLKYILNWTSVDTNTGSGFDGDLIRLGVQARF